MGGVSVLGDKEELWKWVALHNTVDVRNAS